MRILLRNSILLSFYILFAWSAKAQLTTTTASYSSEDHPFGSITNSVISTNFYFKQINVAEITGTNPNAGAIKSWWAQYDTITNGYTNIIQTSFTESSILTSIKDGEGYEFSSTNGTDTVRYYCWTFEPKFTLDAAFVDPTVTNCTNIGLQAKTTTKPLFYRNPQSTTTKIPVDYKLSYKWTASPRDTIIKNTSNPIFIQPIEDTEYSVTVYGLLKDSATIKIPKYTATGLRADIRIKPRYHTPYENEIENLEGDSIKGSGPLKELFENTSKGTFTKSTVRIYLAQDLTKAIYEENYDANRPYIFSTANTYYVEIQVDNSNTTCSSTSNRLEVVIPKSMLGIPNCFTPNEDGVNDKFLISYCSLKTYQIYIYNRWGKLVYQSDNPGEGWDGSGAFGPAATGVYFYVISATGVEGTDYNKNGRPITGSITLLRELPGQ